MATNPTGTKPGNVTAEDEAHHPGVGEYIQVGVILAVLTAIEVALYFMGIAAAVAVPVLVLLTVMKFVLVAFWFMHLRFDSAVFRRLFFAGLFLAMAVFAGMLASI